MHCAFNILCTGVHDCNKFFVSRKDARSTNVGRVLEAHGHHLLGSYKDPIASFHDFYQLSIEKPEVTKINRPLNLITNIIVLLTICPCRFMQLIILNLANFRCTGKLF